MDKVKRVRASTRAILTRATNDLRTELDKVNPDKIEIKLRIQKSRELLNKVTEMNATIGDWILDNDDTEGSYEDEQAACEDYNDRVQLVLLQAEEVLSAALRSQSPDPSIQSSASIATSEKKRNFKLPKIELKKFTGEPLEWLGWWAQFSKIHEDESLHETDKFQYLSQAMVEGTRARKLVEGYPQSAANYPKVIAALQDRFGDKVILSEVYVRQLHKMMMVNCGNRGNVELAVLYDDLESHLRALETLLVSAEDSAIFLYPLVESSLPIELVKIWQRSPNSGYDGATQKKPNERLGALMKFLSIEVKGAERLTYVHAGLDEPSHAKQGSSKPHKKREDLLTVSSLYVGDKEVCVFCQKSSHGSAACFQAKNMTLEERRARVRDSRACFACLKRGHNARRCRSSLQCSNCGRKHFTVMCPGTSDQQDTVVESKEVKVTTTNTSGISSGVQVLMKTVKVWIKSPDGKLRKVRLLFDEGSQRSYIKTSVVEDLKFPVLEQFAQQNNLFGGHVTKVRDRKLHRVIVKGLDERSQHVIDLIGEDIICTSCPTVPQGPWIYELARHNIQISDLVDNGSDDIHILIGSDRRESLMTGRRHKLSGGLVAVESVFGWTLSGPILSPVKSCATMVINMLTTEEKRLPKLWDLETLGIQGTAEKICEEEYGMRLKDAVQTTMTRDKDGRYIVRLPWINEPVEIPSNREVAFKRLTSVTERLKKQGEFERYDQVFTDWEEEKLIEVSYNNVSKQHFLPHRPVFKLESATTPVRPVFDASCRVGNNPSLNQCLEKGPNMLQLIPTILQRFRAKPIGLLAWIEREEDWGTFVGNRCKEIVSMTKKEDWKYVPGPMNPADLPSRGCSPSHLLRSNWWEGPAWLKKPEEDWPIHKNTVDEDQVEKEKKKTSFTILVTSPNFQPRFSSYMKNVRVATYVRRFVDNCRHKNRSQSQNLVFKLDELRRGERDMLYEIQRRRFPSLPKTKNLEVILKEDGLYHVKTRLLQKQDTEGFKEPVLLPSNEPYVRQLVEYIHRAHCHAGTQFVLGKLRERYWIPRERKTVGNIIRKCTVCLRYVSKGLSCESSSLPKDRVDEQFAFQTTGVDLAGPLLLKGGKKAWVVLYTCALYRGVVLDVVDSLSAEEFLTSLEKFCCTTGRPSHIYSDNATNFVGANNILKQIKWKQVEDLLPVKKIQWSFNPPTAAWWGGWWERLIRTIKELLRRMLGTAKLSRKELEKCLAEVAYTINHRPLTTLTEDGNDLIPLVPAMFMRDLPISGLPERELITGQDLEKRFFKIQELKRALAARFRKEYLGNLVERKAVRSSSVLEVGDVVLVGADNKKRYEWPLGRILKLIAGQDGKIRVAKVKDSDRCDCQAPAAPLSIGDVKIQPSPVQQ